MRDQGRGEKGRAAGIHREGRDKTDRDAARTKRELRQKEGRECVCSVRERERESVTVTVGVNSKCKLPSN